MDLTTLFGGLRAAELIGWIVAVCALLAFIGKGWPLLRKLADAADKWEQLDTIPDRFTALEAKVERIHHEVTPNHGGSAKDAINRIERKLDDPSTGTIAISARLAAVESAVNDHAEKLIRDHGRITRLEENHEA